MKVKPTQKRGHVIVELDRRDAALLAEGSQKAGAVPFKLGKILVPIDFSDCSQKALQYAVPFARQFGAELTLLYVVQINYYAGDFGSVDVSLLEAEMRTNGEKQLQELAAREVSADIACRALIRTGRIVTEVVETAREGGIDLIVLSTHGHTGLKHVLLGSVAENVVRHAPCPVLIVRENEHEFISR